MTDKLKKIGPDLFEAGLVSGKPYRLKENAKRAFQGTLVNGTGFILEKDEAAAILESHPQSRDVIQPYFVAEDLASSPDQTPQRMIINFRDWSADIASKYEHCFRIVTERVKPHRDVIVARGRQVHEYDYWKFWDKRLESYQKISNLSQVIIIGLAGKYLLFDTTKTGMVYAHRLGIVIDDRFSVFAILQSSFHSIWAWKQCSTIGASGIGYSLSDAFETFPFPEISEDTETIGRNFQEERSRQSKNRNEGLTDLYNKVHNPSDASADICKIRDLIVQLDQVIANNYGWTDFDLEHGFYETKQGIRFTVAEAASREILDRLLTLNHRRHEEEVAAKSAKAEITPAKRGRKKKKRP